MGDLQDPQNRGFPMVSIRNWYILDDLGVPPFLETSIETDIDEML